MEDVDIKLFNLSESSSQGNPLPSVNIQPDLSFDMCDETIYGIENTIDSKVRISSVLSDASDDFQTAHVSSEALTNREDQKEIVTSFGTPTNPPRTLKYIMVKREPAACKGQGDDADNSVLSSSYSLSFKELENTRAEESVPISSIDLDNNPHFTYTTLLPRQENVQAIDENDASFPSPQDQDFVTSSPVFPSPIITRSSSYTRRKRMPIIPRGVSYSPIPKMRAKAPRQRYRRARRARYRYNPQILHPSTEESGLNLASSGSSMYFGGVSSLESSLSGNVSNMLSRESLTLGSNSSPVSFYRNSSETLESQLSFEYPRVPNNTPNSESDLVDEPAISDNWISEIQGQMDEPDFDPREVHNEKERYRRLRIKHACQYMRDLLPAVSDKTDNASVFEEAVDFIRFMRARVGNSYDLEFINENYVY